MKSLLKQLDSPDEAVRNAALAELKAGGEPVFQSLLAQANRQLRWLRISFYGLIAPGLGFLVVLFLTQHDKNEPAPPGRWLYLNMELMLLIGNMGIIGLFSNRLLPTVRALAALQDVRALGILAVARRWMSDSEYVNHPRDRTDRSNSILLRMLPLANPENAYLIDAEARHNLHRVLARNQPGDVQAEVIRTLVRIGDTTAVERIRKQLKKQKDWDVREAAEDYLTAFDSTFTRSAALQANPDTMVLPSTTEVTPIDSSEQRIKADVLQRVMCLGSRDKGKREAAETALRNSTPDELRTLLTLLNGDAPGNRIVGWRIIALCCLATTLLSPILVLCLSIFHFKFLLAPILPHVSVIVGFPIGASVIERTRRKRRVQLFGEQAGGVFPMRRALHLLAEQECQDALPVLVEALPEYQQLLNTVSGIRRPVYDSLIRLLLRLQASDAALLTPAHRKILNAQLTRCNTMGENLSVSEVELGCAILKAWEQVGDKDALSVVEKLAATKSRHPLRKQLREAALSCLPYLQTRVERLAAPQTLLRAADARTDATETLLRAAANTRAEAEPRQLLRSSVGSPDTQGN